MFGLFSGWMRTKFEAEKRERAAYAQDLMEQNIKARQLEAAKFAAEHNCSIVIIDPDGKMHPG